MKEPVGKSGIRKESLGKVDVLLLFLKKPAVIVASPLLVEESAEFLNERPASLEIRVRYYVYYVRRHTGSVI